MEKYIVTPIKHSENEGGKALMERNSPMESTEDVVKINENLVKKRIELTQVVDKSQKIKKMKLKKSRGEKRKFPERLDSLKKIKRKKDDKMSGNVQCDKEGKEPDILHIEEISLAHQELQSKNLLKKKVSPIAGNDSDVENGERIVKQKSSRKNKAIASTCKDTLDVLLKFDLDVLNLLDKSLKIIKNHSLLDNKYISMDILIDLITLALGKAKVSEVDSEKELSFIITKCASMLCRTPKRSKTTESISTFSPKNELNDQEESPAVLSLYNEETENKSQDVEEVMEISDEDASAKLSEKSQEPAVEKSGKNFCITNYFKKLKKTVEDRDTNERFRCFTTKTDMFLAPRVGGELTGVRREKFEEAFTSQSCAFPDLGQLFGKPKRIGAPLLSGSRGDGSVDNVASCEETRPTGFENRSADGKDASEMTKPEVRKPVTLTRVDKPKINPVEAACRTKAKLLQFHDNRRPPYWGTWRRKSEAVGPRRPFRKDKIFNYEVDSDDEWEEEEEPGESLHGSDDDREPEEDYEVDNDFFVPHGYLSDDENPEKENVSSKKKLKVFEEQFTTEQKQKMRKMTPIVFGAFWIHKGPPCEETLHRDLQVEKLQYVPWTSLPVEIEEEPMHTVRKSKKKIFPSEEIPNLIKMIHGSPHNSDHLARKFLLYWETEKIPDGNRPGLTKVCVQKKIKELAAWQQGNEKGKMCWQVPKEKREEFGAEVDTKPPEKKLPKCFIWKFVRKADKAPKTTNPSPPAPPLEPQVIIMDS